jgi:RND family efflux transporter MFP subunit
VKSWVKCSLIQDVRSNTVIDIKAQLTLLLVVFQLIAPGGASSATAQDIPALECIVEPEMTIALSSSIDGVVTHVAVDKSDPVSKGQVLATLESSVEEAEVALARARADMEEEIKAKQVQLDLSNTKKRRVLELYSKKSIPGFEKDEAEADAALAELELKQAYSNQKLANLQLDRATANLKLRSVVSPIDGVVVDRYVHPGESVKDRPLLKLAKIDPMRVEIIANSELFGLIKTGMTAEIIVEGPTETRLQATVSVVDGLVDAASGTFGIRLSVPNQDNKVVGGLKCKAVFNTPGELPIPPVGGERTL